MAAKQQTPYSIWIDTFVLGSRYSHELIPGNCCATPKFPYMKPTLKAVHSQFALLKIRSQILDLAGPTLEIHIVRNSESVQLRSIALPDGTWPRNPGRPEACR